MGALPDVNNIEEFEVFFLGGAVSRQSKLGRCGFLESFKASAGFLAWCNNSRNNNCGHSIDAQSISDTDLAEHLPRTISFDPSTLRKGNSILSPFFR